MMPTLMNWYPGDRACDFFLILALGVTLLSGSAWVVAWRLPRRPATRHLVLCSALICCLAMPVLASVVTASGLMLIAIPLLPTGPAGRDPDRAGHGDRPSIFGFEPAPTVRGRVVVQGKPVAGARVYLATDSQMLGIEDQNENTWSSNQKVVTDSQGAFAFPAQFERSALVAIHDAGYAEEHLEPDRQPGEVKLGAWARVEGRLMEAGQPVPTAWIHLTPVRSRLNAAPHIQDGLSVKTDPAGHFVFPRVPPVKSSVRAQISVWRESPIRSSRSVPLELQPGQRVEVDLGARGSRSRGG